MTAYAERIACFQSEMRAERIALAVLAPTSQMRYLTGWAEPAHERLLALLVPSVGSPVFVVPAINEEHARHNPAGITSVRSWEDGKGWQMLMTDLLDEMRLETGAIAVDDELPSVHLLRLQKIAAPRLFVPAGRLMSRLRAIKRADELELLERSADITDAVYEECLTTLRAGMTERELEDIIARAYAARGTAPDFSIICFGPNSALPHHHTADARLEPGQIVLIDIGCSFEHYASDITRTVAFGQPDPEAFRVYDVVYRAHMAGLAACKPGTRCEDVDKAARAVIAEAGYGPYFIHRLGHGIGLDGHEEPNLVEGNTTPLEPGMCFSDEPGIYLSGRFGVRIENCVTVKEHGGYSFNAAPPKELVALPATA